MMNKRKIYFTLALLLGAAIVPKASANASIYNGWEKSNGSWYYYNTGKMCTGWIKDHGTWYYLSSNGTTKTGWVKDNGTWYYLNSDGSMKTGWINDNDTWYYLKQNGEMATGWIQDNNDWYYLDSDGSMKTGKIILGDKQYYLDTNGKMCTGYIKYRDREARKSAWYYADSDGNLKTGWIYYDNTWYYMTEDRVLASDINVDGYYINKDGIWDGSCDDKVMAATEKQEYNYTTKNIKIKVINNTDKTIKYSRDFVLEYYDEDDKKWTTAVDEFPKREDVEVSPDETSLAVLDLAKFRDKIETGKFRIGVKVNGEYIYDEFKIVGYGEERKVDIDISKGTYYISEIKSIPYTITNNSDDNLEYTNEYNLQKLNACEWQDVKLKDSNSEIISYELNPGEKASYNIPLSDIDEKLKPGMYQLSKKLDGLIEITMFTLSNDNIAKITTNERVYYDASEKIELTISNESSEEISYDQSYRIEKFDKTWQKVSLRDTNFGQELVTLKPGEKGTQTIYFNNIDDDSMFGEYRIVKEIDGNEIYAEFNFNLELGQPV